MHELLTSLPLYLGSTEKEVRRVLKLTPAVVLFKAHTRELSSSLPFHLVFDWDSTISNKDGDALILTKGRTVFCDHEWTHRHTPHSPGALHSVFIAAVSCPKFRVSILTSRTGKEAQRVLTTLESWNVSTAALHFAGNQPKGPIAAAIQADLFLDDILRHVKDAVAHGINSGWHPIGRARE